MRSSHWFWHGRVLVAGSSPWYLVVSLTGAANVKGIAGIFTTVSTFVTSLVVPLL